MVGRLSILIRHLVVLYLDTFRMKYHTVYIHGAVFH